MRTFILLFLVTVVVSNCSLAVDTSDLDRGCPLPNQKVCGGACVNFDDPDFGCGSTSCAPCDPGRLQGFETWLCLEQQCRIGCPANFGCTRCMAALATDEDNCGSCGNKCEGRRCVNGACL